MNPEGLLFQPLNPQNFENARDWQEQQLKAAVKYLQSKGYSESLRRFNPASHEFSVSLDPEIRPMDVAKILKFELVPWMKTRFDHFRNEPNLIRVDWPTCADHENEIRVHNLLKRIFSDLSLTFDLSVPCPLSLCTKLSIRVPKRIYGPTPTRYHFPDEEIINLEHAADSLREFYWAGDYVYFDMGFAGLPSDVLTVLSMTDCKFGLPDVMELLEYVPNVQILTLRTVTDYWKLDYRNLIHPSKVYTDDTKSVPLRSLISLTIESTISLRPFFHRAELPKLQSLYLSVAGGVGDVEEYFGWKDITLHSVTIECPPSNWPTFYDRLKDAGFRNLEYVAKDPL